jgi:hypothetical protein
VLSQPTSPPRTSIQVEAIEDAYDNEPTPDKLLILLSQLLLRDRAFFRAAFFTPIH